MIVTLVARDVAPSQAFEMLQKALEVGGHVVHTFLGKGDVNNRLPAEQIINAVHGSDTVVIGMSSSPLLAAEEFTAASAARDAGKPFGFYADTYNCHKRPWFDEYRGSARFLFVLNDAEASDALHTFPNATVVAAGNPTWEKFFFPTYSRAQARACLGLADEFAILCPGGKSGVVNILHFSGVIEAALAMRRGGANPIVLISLHPGDNTSSALYDDIVKWSGGIAGIVSRDLMTASDMLPGIDVVVESASTVGIEAAHLRIPVFDFFTSMAINRLMGMGSYPWEPCELAVAMEIRDVDTLFRFLDGVRKYGWSAPRRKRQEEVYPSVSEPGTVVKRMVEYLEDLTTK